MSSPNTIERTVTITTTPEMWAKLQRFFALMHFNQGHSATFGLDFDGDGADTLHIEPPPPAELRKPVQHIADATGSLELANTRSYIARRVVTAPFHVVRGLEPELIEVDGTWASPQERVVRRYER